MYSPARALLFRLDPETAHGVTLTALDLAHRWRLSRALGGEAFESPVTLMGLRFPNRVGLAAGLDKDGAHVDALGALGFGFLEVGTVTPRAQPGNPRPRLFRLPEYQAIINRMGFNNSGVEPLVEHVRQRHFNGVLGINIGKNLTTEVADAAADYLSCLEAVHAHADYVTVNISSPNTPGLRELQFGDHLQQLLTTLTEAAMRLDVQNGRHVPLAVKIAPDMSDEELELVAHCLAESGVEAVIATNTTISRTAVAGSRLGKESGGLSGAPVREASTRMIAALRERLPGVVIIGVGGILEAEHAREKRAAGADLVQLYTGLIYRGPALVGECARALA
ncbi:dihydroorotate oxidase A [Kushneria sinocarnis]|uniref:Dihydroorotate dehydrogenase (quinone) n=1 Tax=Kushneria sinocarnis TaxID=595502 RepID=A0A420WTG9_9GAMM|nr:quinone-dependent dihydroorotate dehydrogenase [Kushneria sinocarnis]RKQ96358.1 dihydroorotate oxidase A [Kushneria sinocarnis]